jgi:hypothetical protein
MTVAFFLIVRLLSVIINDYVVYRHPSFNALNFLNMSHDFRMAAKKRKRLKDVNSDYRKNAGRGQGNQQRDKPLIFVFVHFHKMGRSENFDRVVFHSSRIGPVDCDPARSILDLNFPPLARMNHTAGRAFPFLF